jgi:hypothetical protein
MSSLRDLQLALQAGILLREAPAVLDPDPGKHYSERFATYADGYRIRLTEALRSNYPVLHQVLGDDEFAELAERFLEAEPSATPSIRWFGSRLHAFVARDPDALPHPALADLVAFEWALGLAFDAADIAAVDGQELAATPAADWHALRFALHPSATLLQLDWAVEPIARALKDDPDATTAEPEANEHAVLTWRRGLEALWRSLDEREALALRRLDAGASFGELCEELARGADDSKADGALSNDTQAAAVAAAMLSRWVRDHVLIRRA